VKKYRKYHPQEHDLFDIVDADYQQHLKLSLGEGIYNDKILEDIAKDNTSAPVFAGKGVVHPKTG
jgi:hypothetical protein